MRRREPAARLVADRLSGKLPARPALGVRHDTHRSFESWNPNAVNSQTLLEGGWRCRAACGAGRGVLQCNVEGLARCGPPHSLLLTMRKGFLVMCELLIVMHTQSSVSERSDWPKIRGMAMLSIAAL